MDNVIDYIAHFASNFWKNLGGAFDDMSGTRWLRMIAVVGAYVLFRPYLVKLGEKIQTRQYQKATDEKKRKDEEEAKARGGAVISPNALRGHVEEIKDGEEGKEEGKSADIEGEEGGKKVRRRQKKETNEQQEGVRDPDAELLDQLVDYVEGEDGW